MDNDIIINIDGSIQDANINFTFYCLNCDFETNDIENLLTDKKFDKLLCPKCEGNIDMENI